MVIALIIIIPIIAFISAYMTLKAYRLGITHNYNIRHDIEPIKEEGISFNQVFQSKEKEKPQDMTQVLNEWLNGEEKK